MCEPRITWKKIGLVVVTALLIWLGMGLLITNVINLLRFLLGSV